MKISSFGQLSFLGDPLREPDRNFDRGGRSFYFFDFDDNVVHLDTKIILFHRDGREIGVSTTEYATIHHQVAKAGTEWADFEVRFDPQTGSYRNFRDRPKERLEEGRQQPLVEDMLAAMENPLVDWRGPSWNFFVHAVNNTRPISVITARGHHPHTLRRAIDLLVLSKDLPANPSYLSLYPVSHPEIRAKLGDADGKLGTAELKKLAIKAAVQDAFECYGENPHHRFGMSDDDPSNVELIRQAFADLKQSHPHNAFFVFNTYGRQLVREEVLNDGSLKKETIETEQTKLFGDGI